MDPTIIKARLGKREVNTWLPDMSTREDLVIAWGEAHGKGLAVQRRVWAAAIGLCTRAGRESKADYAACKFDVLDYGGRVWRHLADVEKLTIPEAKELGSDLLARCQEGCFPRDEEVEDAAGNSEGREGSSTARP